jgi:hypothetical protein
MKWIKTFEKFNTRIGKRPPRSPVSVGFVKQPVEIRIDIEKISHAGDRQWRHGVDEKITNDDIIETIELAIEQITISLMRDEFDIFQTEDDYPTKGVKAGEPNRFVIKNKTNNLNVVCQLTPGDYEFTLTVITVMTKTDFRVYPGQFVIEVRS